MVLPQLENQPNSNGLLFGNVTGLTSVYNFESRASHFSPEL